MLRRRSPKGGAASKRAPAARGAGAKRPCSTDEPRSGSARESGARGACRTGSLRSRPAGRGLAGLPLRPTHVVRECPPRRSRASPAWAPRGVECGASLGVSGCGLRARRCVERSEHGYVRLGGRRASPGGRASGGERSGMGYTVSHPMDAAPRQPRGASRRARALRLQDRLASLASCGPRACGPSPTSNARGAGVPASAVAGFARVGASGGGVRGVAGRFGVRVAGASLRGAFRARVCTPRRSPGFARRSRLGWGAKRHGLHRLPSDGRGSAPAARRFAPREGAPPAGQARFARVLRAAGARFTRRAASRLGCGACSLRSRSTGRGRPFGPGSALRASPAEQARFARAPLPQRCRIRTVSGIAWGPSRGRTSPSQRSPSVR